ncbi:MAG: hypothetical protein ABIG44_09860 [Planctomycetota bacterium]
MSFQPFPGELAESRLIEIPADLDDAGRKRFVTLIRKAVQKQAELAGQSNAILALTGDLEQEGNLLRIRHEPATPAEAAVVLDSEERPDLLMLNWLTWSVAQALATAHASMLIHGSLQNGALYLDAMGRLKLGDFGIGPAFELVCGGAVRRYLACDVTADADEQGRIPSGKWILLSEDARRDFGWIAPFFPHELLENDDTRLNVKSDQFGLGTLLFLWATGSHPYGASLGDPTLNFYFHLEPFALDEERTEWSTHFERERGGVATSADEPVLSWARLVERTLSSDSGQRFADLNEVLGALHGIPPAWEQATSTLGAAMPLLRDGQPEEFLAKVGPWGRDETLPEIWRERLARQLAIVKEQKEVIVRRRTLAARLKEADELLSGGDIPGARAAVEAVMAAEECDDALRRGAAELLEWCAEQERLVETALDEQAREAFDSAREALTRGDFGDARLCLNAVVEDPASPDYRVEQAQQLLTEIEEVEEGCKRQTAELEAARAELERAEFQPAIERLESVLAEANLIESLATPARQLLDKIQAKQQTAAEYEEMLRSAEQAWQQADLETVQSLLASVPAAIDIPPIAQQHEALTACCESLRAALDARDAAEQLLAADNPQAALTKTDEGLRVEQLPGCLEQDLSELRTRCATALEERHRATIEHANQQLQHAQKLYDQGEADACRQAAEPILQQADILPEETRTQAEELLTACQRLSSAGKLLDEITRQLSNDDLDSAEQSLSLLPRDGLPDTILQRGAELARQIKEARQDHAERQLLRLRAQLDDAEQKVAVGELDEVEPILAAVEESTLSSEGMIGRVVAIRGMLVELVPIDTTLKAAQGAVQDGDVEQAGMLLEQGGQAAGVAVVPLPAELPAWAEQRAASLRQQITEFREERRQEAVATARKALDAAEKALAAGDPATARSRLKQAAVALKLDPELALRHEGLEQQASELEEWLPRLQAAEAALKKGDFAAAYKQADQLLKAEAIPPVVQERIQAVQQQAKQRIAARRKEISAELATLEQTLTERGRRAKTLPQQLQTLRADTLASKEQRQEVDKLLERFEALPPLKRSPVPIIAAVAVVAVLGAGGAWMFWPEPTPPEPPDRLEQVPGLVDLIKTESPPLADLPVEPDTVVVQPDDTVDPDVAREFPGEITPVPTFVELVQTSSQALADLLSEVDAETASQSVAFAEIDPNDWQKIPDEPDSGTLSVTATTSAGDVLVGVTAQYREAPDPWEFVLELEDAELRKIAEWLHPRIEAKIAAQDELDDKKDLCQTYAGPLDRLKAESWAENLQLPKACQPDITPPKTANRTWTLLELVNKHNSALGGLLTALLPDAETPLPLPEFSPEDWRVDGIQYDCTIAITALDDQLTLAVNTSHDGTGENWNWNVTLPDSELSKVYRWISARVASELTTLADAGRVAAVWQRHKELRGQLESLREELQLDNVNNLLAGLPPAWSEDQLPVGYVAGTTLHPDLGYPTTLTAGERTLLLVYLHPKDLLWDTINESSNWQVYYIDATEMPAAWDKFSDAQGQATSQFERDLPTRSEWMRAALMLRADPAAQDFIGGRYEWCRDDENGAPWVCGGCTLRDAGGQLIPPPPDSDKPAELWTWLQGKLVTHQRQYGDELTSFRTVLRLFPQSQ